MLRSSELSLGVIYYLHLPMNRNTGIYRHYLILGKSKLINVEF